MSRAMEDLTGKRFGRLTVIGRGKTYSSGNVCWTCICDCGNTTNSCGTNLRSGKSKSCGRCVCSERMAALNTKHSGFGTRLYEIWRQMHRRCYGRNTKAYKDYGGRGITICKDWQEYGPFEKWAMSHGYREDLTIDRIDVNGNYEPSNCRWATMKEQSNNRRNNRVVVYNGESHTVSEWADIYAVDQRKLWQRLNARDWDVGEALRSFGVFI